MLEILNLVSTVLLATIGLWAIYLPLAWFWEEKFFFGLMRKEDKSRQYWVMFSPAFLKRELKAALAFFIFLVVFITIESIMGRDR
jgi:hypothetical protein